MCLNVVEHYTKAQQIKQIFSPLHIYVEGYSNVAVHATSITFFFVTCA